MHPLAGVLSAYGMGLADQNVMREQAIELPLSRPRRRCRGDERAGSRSHRGRQAELRQQASGRPVTVHRRVHVRYEGTDSALVVPFGDAAQVQAAFEAAYRQRFAFLMQGERRLIVEAVSVEAVGGRRAGRAAPRDRTRRARCRAAETVRMCSAAGSGWTRRWWCAKTCGPATSSPARPSSPRRTRPRWSSPAGRRG